jgi:glycosyltransferase involved in cell wall biosynthesis
MTLLPPLVITPSRPDRTPLLAEAYASVEAQTIACTHLIGIDHAGEGPALIRNAAMRHSPHPVVAFLDDDDLMDPDHLEVLTMALVEHEADLVFSWYRKQGSTPETERIHVWDDYAYGVMLGGRNLIPVTVVARREAILDAGGFDPDDRYEDYALWMRMLAQEARIVVVPRETWTYRMLGDNRTWT